MQDAILAIDAQTGKTVYKVSLDSILHQNALFALASRNQHIPDPFHLNDVQPVLENGPYWKKGDLFISIRNINTVALFRPSNKRIIWLRSHPWLGQHDVDVINDSLISVFNNNILRSPRLTKKYGNSGLIVYNFNTDQTSRPFEDWESEKNIYTEFEGLAEWYPEEQLLYLESNDQKRLFFYDYANDTTYECGLKVKGEWKKLRWNRLLPQ